MNDTKRKFSALTSLLTIFSASQLVLAAPPLQKVKVPVDANGKPLSPKPSDFTSIHFSPVLPTNFLPRYPGSTVGSFSNTTKGTPAASSTMSTTDSPDTVLKWYQNYLNTEHWAVRSPSKSSLEKLNKQGTLNFLNAQKENQQATIVCAKSPKTGKTTISISWSLQSRPSF